MQETYRGILVESESEIQALDWLFELQDRGFVHSIERGPEMLIGSGLDNSYTKETQLKTKVKIEDKKEVLLAPHYYTPEFVVVWRLHTPEKLVWGTDLLNAITCQAPLIGHPFPVIINENTERGMMTYIEVKPAFDYQNMTRAFKINQKWVWQSRKIFVNLIEPISLYKKTFTPMSYLTTRKKKTEREIKWDIQTCDGYLKSIGYDNSQRTDTIGGVSTEQLQSN